jgi:hypothetical protein
LAGSPGHVGSNPTPSALQGAARSPAISLASVDLNRGMPSPVSTVRARHPEARWAAVPTVKTLQAEIAERMRRGDSFDVVEVDLIDGSGLPEAEKAALWLYGWSFVPWQRQRREALAQIDALVDSQDSAARALGHLQLAGRTAR